MEIVEVLLAFAAGMAESGEGCLCFMQIVAMFLDGTSVFTGYRAVRENRKRKTLREEGITPEGRNPYLRASWLLIPCALAITALVIWIMVQSRRR